MTDTERKRVEKEIMGLQAKLRWDHVADHLKETWRERIVELKERLRANP
jgi:hypothetical protein